MAVDATSFAFLLPKVVLGTTAMSQDDFEELMPSLGEMMRNVMRYGEPK